MTVVITGANRGIGLALTQHYTKKEWRVIACCRNPEHASKLKNCNLEVFKQDVSKQEDINALKAYLNSVPVDVLINNAGIMGGTNQSFGNIDYDTWEQVLSTNLLAPYRMVEALIDNIANSKKRIVVNISSVLGSITQCASKEKYIYASSKTSLNMLTQNLSIDLNNRGIIVLSIHPGWVKTDMGGKDAQLTAGDSAAQIANVIDRATLTQTGLFFNYDGSLIPW